MPVFGYVHSRRLGKSLGVNNIPFKHCSYSCVYCQLGRTSNLTITRREFYKPRDLVREALNKLNEVDVDYVTFVSSGEPTLDKNLGLELEMLEQYKTAVITNSSLTYMEDVRKDLLKSDLVSFKIDSVTERIWKKINRPHKDLSLDKILDGILDFSNEFRGTIITETMLIREYNDNFEEIKKIAEFLSELNPAIAYLAIPTRPTAEKVTGPKISFILKAKSIFERFVECKLLIEPEKDGHLIKNLNDLIKMAQVHPVKEDVAKKVPGFSEDLFEVVEINGKKYYIKK